LNSGMYRNNGLSTSNDKFSVRGSKDWMEHLS